MQRGQAGVSWPWLPQSTTHGALSIHGAKRAERHFTPQGRLQHSPPLWGLFWVLLSPGDGKEAKCTPKVREGRREGVLGSLGALGSVTYRPRLFLPT